MKNIPETYYVPLNKCIAIEQYIIGKEPQIMEAGAIGIDIGSKNTVIAVVRNRGVEVVQSENGHVTPYCQFDFDHT